MVLPIFQLTSTANSLVPSSLYHVSQGAGDNNQLSLSPSSFKAEQTPRTFYNFIFSRFLPSLVSHHWTCLNTFPLPLLQTRRFLHIKISFRIWKLVLFLLYVHTEMFVFILYPQQGIPFKGKFSFFVHTLEWKLPTQQVFQLKRTRLVTEY